MSDAATSSLSQSLRDAFTANNISQFRTILSDLPESDKTTAWDALGCDAAEQDKPDILALLLPYRPYAVSMPRLPPDSLIACVSDSNSPAVCDVVINAGIDITIPGSFEDDLLVYCIEGNKIKLVEHLLSPPIAAKTGVRLEAMLYGDMYPSLVTARSPEMVQVLLDHGAKLQGSMALHMAAHQRDLTKMQYLLKAGADVNENLRLDEDKPEADWLRHQKEDLGTPLHYAVDRWSLDAVKLLLASGADPTATDFAGRTVLERAKPFSKECPELKELLGSPSSLNG